MKNVAVSLIQNDRWKHGLCFRDISLHYQSFTWLKRNYLFYL